MDYERFGAVVDECGVSDDPAILSPELKVRISPLPEEYEHQAYGLYYPRPDKRIWIPPDADAETAKHELGHAWCEAHYDDIDEPCAEAFRQNAHKGAIAMLKKPVPTCRCNKPAMMAINMSGNYTTIVDITGPVSASPGDIINISTIIRNDWQSDILLMVEGVTSEGGFLHVVDENNLAPGESRIYQGSFVMPREGAAVAEILVYYFNGLEYSLDSEIGAITIYPNEWTFWETIVQADSLENFKRSVPSIDDLPDGTPINIHIEFPSWFPAGPIANLAGAEWVAQRFQSEADIEITDVRSESLYSMDIDGVARGWVVPVGVIIIAGILTALGIAYLVSITLSARYTMQSKQDAYEAWQAAFNALIDAGATPTEAAEGANGKVKQAAEAATKQPPVPVNELAKYGVIALVAVAGIVGLVAVMQAFGKHQLYPVRA